MTRGYYTMASGGEKYYALARTLLLSFKCFSKDPLPFAIICDRENEYTGLFDKVVIIDNPVFNFADKLRLLDLAPFDESIYIDPDSLVYRDLSGLWDFFQGSHPFMALGERLPKDSPRRWYLPENIGSLEDRIGSVVHLQGGLYYVRKAELSGFLSTCRQIALHYHDYHFKFYPDLLTEENTFSLACALHGYLPPCNWPAVFCYYPDSYAGVFDIRKGLVRARRKYNGENISGSFFVHWGTVNTNSWTYRREAYVVSCMYNRAKPSYLKMAMIWTTSHLSRILFYGRCL